MSSNSRIVSIQCKSELKAPPTTTTTTTNDDSSSNIDSMEWTPGSMIYWPLILRSSERHLAVFCNSVIVTEPTLSDYGKLCRMSRGRKDLLPPIFAWWQLPLNALGFSLVLVTLISAHRRVEKSVYDIVLLVTNFVVEFKTIIIVYIAMNTDSMKSVSETFI